MRDDDIPADGLCAECGERDCERGRWCLGCWNGLVSEEMERLGVPVTRKP